MRDFPVHVLDRPSPLLSPELWEIDRPPARIHVRGRPDALALLARLPERGLAVVGTRCPQQRSLAITERALRRVAGAPVFASGHSGLIILSGLALGIDARAHETALATGLPTIAILGCGIDRIYPPENARLARRILEHGGLLVSEFERDAAPVAFQFLMRNRLIATWSKATWVVEASVRSGALNTARWARDHGRACLATPGFPGDPALLGNQDLIDRHHALPFWDAHSLGSVWLELAELGLRRGRASRPTPEALSRNPRAAQLSGEVNRRTLAVGGVHVETLLEWTLAQGWSPMEFYEALQISLQGPSIQDRGGFLVNI